VKKPSGYVPYWVMPLTDVDVGLKWHKQHGFTQERDFWTKNRYFLYP